MHIEHDIDVFTSPALRDLIAQAIRSSNGAFTLDLRTVRYIDSVGLGLLVYTKHVLDGEGRALRLIVQPDSSVERIVGITGLRSLLGVCVDDLPHV
ncbi:MAG TPA: STAS domain-containing protein [Candidatus Baltobacteraceae bacterium]|nr:STAS domain-containing protein [Candidatus Baltobacteraceae bacterium]